MVEYGIISKVVHQQLSPDTLDGDTLVEQFTQAAGAALGEIAQALRTPPEIKGPVEVISHQFVQLGPLMLLTVFFRYSEG